ncbi:MAG: hypothetical protein ACTS4T_01165 [Candidatus Hodgkinia cicadicola]
MITSQTLTAPLTVHRCNPPLGAVQASTKFHNGVHNSFSPITLSRFNIGGICPTISIEAATSRILRSCWCFTPSFINTTFHPRREVIPPH